MPGMRRFLPHLVAAFVVLHVTASCIDSIPNLGMGFDRRAWQEPRVRNELDLWARRLGVEPRAFEDRLYGLAMGLRDVRVAVGTPVAPYLKLSGVRQTWTMFVAGTSTRDRFQLRARACAVDDPSCDWLPLYTRGNHDEALLRDIIEHPRMRSATFRWGWNTKKRDFRRGCGALARLVVKERPEVTVVECRFERSTSPGPRDPARRPPPRWDRSVVVTVADLEKPEETEP